MIGEGLDAILLQRVGQIVALLLREAVDDAALAIKAILDHVGDIDEQARLEFLGKHHILQVGPVE